MALTGIFIALLCAGIHQEPPSADRIRVMQEAHQREHYRAMRAVPQPRRRLPMERMAPKLSEEERAELRAAVERFLRERSGEIVDHRKVRP